MKYLLILISIVSLLSAAEIFKFTDTLHEIVKKNKGKITLSLENQYMQNNIKYLVVPNVFDYIDVSNKLFLDLNISTESSKLEDILQDTSLFGVFLYDVTLYNLSLQRRSLNSSKTSDRKSFQKLSLLLESSQIKVLSDIITVARGYDQFSFAVNNLDLFLASLERKKNTNCEILLKFPTDIINRFITQVLKTNDYQSEYLSKVTEEEINYSLFLMINEKDLDFDTAKAIFKNIDKAVKKYVLKVINSIKTAEPNFLEKLNYEAKKEGIMLHDLKKKYENTNASLNELKNFNIQLYAYTRNFEVLKLLNKIYKINNMHKKLLNTVCSAH